MTESQTNEALDTEQDTEEAEMTVVAVIPARGGSVGIPRKNLVTVGGVPLVARAVHTAKASSHIDRVIVSTDDTEIAESARAAGAEIVWRPADLSGPRAGSEAAVVHGLASAGLTPEIVVLIQATSPFIDVTALDEAIVRVSAGLEDVVFSAAETHDFLWTLGPAGAEAVNHSAATRPMRQDRQPEFRETGAFYVMRGGGFLSVQHRFFGRVGVQVVDASSAQDIDTPADLESARAYVAAHPYAAGVQDTALLDVDAVVTDFDGVHTDDHAHIGADGSEFVTVSRSDGMGVSLLRRAGLPVLILSTEVNPVVSARAQKLGVEVIQGCTDKTAALTEWCRHKSLSPDRVVYLGNDVNDLGAMGVVGWPASVADAHPTVRSASRLVLVRRGGKGAVREHADRILRARTPDATNPAELLARSGAPRTEEELWSYESATHR